MLTTVDDDDLGEVLMHNVMWRMSDTPGRIRFTGARIGADTDAVLVASSASTPTAIADLRARRPGMTVDPPTPEAHR